MVSQAEEDAVEEGHGGEPSSPLDQIMDEMRRVFSLLQVFLRW